MKSKNKKIIIIVASAIIGVVVLFFVIAKFIVVDDCASPCRHTGEKYCIMVCDKITLLDWIFGDR
ncbi:hypothetical protein IKF84_00270 [Candidatus Saccharibacteria bacterium]|nr:hypothetical protein [Candidatus Saccharibacteria bacterium]